MPPTPPTPPKPGEQPTPPTPLTPPQEPVARTESAAKVLYKGTSHVRLISVADLKQVGIDVKDREGAKDLRWDAKNLFMVPMADLSFLSPEEFDRVIKADSDFAVVDADKSLPRTHPHNNRFHQPAPVTEGLPQPGGSTSDAGAGTTTVGGSTAGTGT